MRRLALALTLIAVSEAGTLESWLQSLAFRQLDERRAEIASIKTPEQARARGRKVRAMLLRMIGGLPEGRTPLNLRRTGTLDRGDYRVEKVIYESLPQVYVTANLYVPQTGKGPFPAVLQPVGHSPAAKARAFYQTIALGLVKSGFVVLTYDPLGQGERRLFYDPDLGDSKVGGPTAEHTMAGVQNMLAGESVARYMVWDGMRSIDVLESLPEVDRTRIGVAGCSGGGTLTSYLATLDDRLKAAAPACYISAWEEQLLGTGPQDAEQQFPDQLKEGLDHADFAIAFAPRPFLQVNTSEDFFPISGAKRAFEESKRIYELLGAGDRIAWSVGPGEHGMPKVVREAVYGWMNQWLKGGPPGPLPEPAFQTEEEESLYCTPTGQVGGENASTLNVRRFSKRASEHPTGQELRARIARLTRYDLAGDQPRNARLLMPDKVTAKPVLLIAEPGAETEEFVQAGHPVLVVEAAPEKLAWLAMMTGRPLVGLEIADILRGLDVLAERGLLKNGCTGYARGMAGVAMLHAAVLDQRIGEVTVEGSIISYEAVVRTPIHKGILGVVVPGVLGQYDLPDLAAAIAPRPVTLIGLRMPSGRAALLEEVRQAYSAAKPVIRGL